MQLSYSPSVLKKLKKIPPADLKKIKKKIDFLASNPLSGKYLQGEHSGQLCIRAWPLRIIYTFNSKHQKIEIVTIDYRGQVYK